VVSQYPEFGVSYRSIQDDLADVVQAEAATKDSTNTKGPFIGARPNTGSSYFRAQRLAPTTLLLKVFSPA
jgi:hypothetical protein